jgi:hypothetical protein
MLEHLVCSVALAASAFAPPGGEPTVAPREAAPKSPLARVERPYDARHYHLELSLEPDGSFAGRAEVTVRPARELDVLVLDSFGLTLEGAAVDAQPATFEVTDDAAASTGTLTLHPARPLAAGKDARVEVSWRGHAGSTHQGLFRVDAADGQPFFFTHFEPSYARRLFPCNDQPDDKATFDVVLTVEPGQTALSNGRLASDEVVQVDGRDRRRVRWLMESPISTYLVAVAVGPLTRIPVAGAPVPAALWADKLGPAKLATARRGTAAALVDQAAFLGTAFPFARYDQVLVPRYAWGGMENATMTLERESALVDEPGAVLSQPGTTGLIAHELAHQWFGDLVTCRGWSDTWLNEGFATYMGWRTQATLWPRELGDVDRATRLLVTYFREEDGPRSHPLAVGDAPSPEDVFDATSYTKGAAVLRMLESWLGPERMGRALHDYLARHAFANASSDDLFADIARSTHLGSEVRAFQRSWVARRGYPVLSPTARWTGRAVALKVKQRPNHADDKEPFAVRLPVLLERMSPPAYRKEVTVVLDRESASQLVVVPAEPEVIVWNQGLAALARVDEAALTEPEWIAGALRATDALWRLQAAFALIAPMAPLVPGAVREPSAPTLETLSTMLTKDPSPYVRAAVMNRLGLAPGRLPASLGPVLRELAEHGEAAPWDAVGTMRVRAAALRLLGKVDDQAVGPWLAAQVVRPDVPLDLLGGYAVGAARAGQDQALEQALAVARARGYVYLRTVAEGFGAIAGEGAGPALASVFHTVAGDNEAARLVFAEMDQNRSLKGSAALPAFVRDFVLGDPGFGEDIKARALRLLDDARTDAARDALTAVAKDGRTQWLRASAARVLEHNFGDKR